MSSPPGKTHGHEGPSTVSPPRNSRKSYRPDLPETVVSRLVRDLYGLTVTSCRELDSYDDRNYHITVLEEGWSPLRRTCGHKTETLWPHGYVLKVLNSLDSQRADHIEVKNRLIVHAAEAGFPTPRPLPSLDGKLSCPCRLTKERALDGQSPADGGDAADTYLVRLLEYLPGCTLASVPLTAHLAFQVGQYAARMDLALSGFDDTDCPELVVLWNMQTIPFLRPLLTYIGDDSKVKVVAKVIEDFENKILKSQRRLQKGFIHGDFNDYNILVQPEDTDAISSASEPRMRVSGILDFGDATKSFLIVEVAIAMTYMMVQCPPDLDPDEMAGHVLAGYLSEMSLSREEVELLPLTVCARLSQSLTNGYHRLVLEPDNAYCLVHALKVWPHLQRLWQRSARETIRMWERVAAFHGSDFPGAV